MTREDHELHLMLAKANSTTAERLYWMAIGQGMADPVVCIRVLSGRADDDAHIVRQAIPREEMIDEIRSLSSGEAKSAAKKLANHSSRDELFIIIRAAEGLRNYLRTDLAAWKRLRRK
jgi:hypothetical protein